MSHSKDMSKFERILCLFKELPKKAYLQISPEDIFFVVQEEMSQVLPNSTFSFFLTNETETHLKGIMTAGETCGTDKILLEDKSIQKEVFTKRKSCTVPLKESHPSYSAHLDPAPPFICAPLMTSHSVYGVMNVIYEKSDILSNEDCRLIEAVALLSATMYENIFLFDQAVNQMFIQNSLERYLSPQLVQVIKDSKGEREEYFKSKKKDVCILFSEVVNFSELCEKFPPEVIVEKMNLYFNEAVKIIFKYEGSLNKVVKETTMTLFGAPISIANPEEKAIKTAIEVQKRVQDFPDEWIKNNLKLRIGINAGVTVVGNLGSALQLEYTAIGDTVNVGQRIESAAEAGQIFVSKTIYERTKNLFTFRNQGDILLKGHKEPVQVYEVVYLD